MSFGAQRAETDQSVFWYFFDPANFEMGVKMVNACSLNSSHWVFVSGLTNQEYGVTITDTVTSRTRTYSNPLGSYPQTVGATDASTAFSCSVDPGCEAPQARNDSATTGKDAAVTIEVLGNDSDGGDPPLRVVSVTQPSHGSTSITGDDKKVRYTPATGYVGSDSFQYTIENECGSTSSAAVNVTVTEAPNHPPVIESLTSSPSLPSVNTPVTISGVTSDPDGDTVSWTVTLIPDGGNAVFEAGAPQSGTGNISTTIRGTSPGAVKVRATINDGRGLGDEKEISITFYF